MFIFMAIMAILFYAAGMFLFYTLPSEGPVLDKEGERFNKMFGIAFMTLAVILTIAAAYMPI